MRIVQASYTSYSVFKISSKIPLLSVKENNLADHETTPWSWWVKWDTLYYRDASGELKTIKEKYMCEHDMKRPDDYETDDDGDDSDSDSDDEHPCKYCEKMNNWEKSCWCEYCDKHTCFECDPTHGGHMYGAICPDCFNDGVHIADNYAYYTKGDDEELLKIDDEELKISTLFSNCVLTDDY